MYKVINYVFFLAFPSKLSSPSVVVDDSVAMTTTDATVMFSVEGSELSQNLNESYVIRYRGVERDTEERQTAIAVSTLGTSNTSYSITLTELQENTTYKYSIVIITNCIGNISTTERNFTTPYQLKGKRELVHEAYFFYKISVIIVYFTAPALSPVNCTNTTFLPHMVTLTWSTPPPLVLGEKIIGYTLNCTIVTNHSLNSTTSTITITAGILPYTNYNCKLTAQNIIGSSPPANCTFKTSQDG